ncbi:sugar phosphate isomerase/epimerase family protein [Paenibacillus campinasensis]|uniref:TIM barrel protein n=1 Tax=Paenibacillus campinasensis TaxID=66347 RepID=A0A268EUY4_9BACL|nr:sugar phosphate isomerase/epimerase family protein [Paenibacillus campinasensis]MUG68564.1 TIM barrel protein [Paenibacillus campinasensis]PAD76930.1 hypothetical protein CHH67_11180 [Paenibacillus campinasensis]
MDRDHYSVSTYAYIDTPLIETVSILSAAGWKQIEIMCEGGHEEVLAWPEERIAELEQMGRERGIRFSVHAPFTGCNPAAEDPEERKRSELVVLNTIRVAELLNSSFIVLHPGRGSGGWSPAHARGASGAAAEQLHEAKRRVSHFLARILEMTAESDIVIALENAPPYPGLYGVEMSFLRDIVDTLDSPRVGIVFDAGHAHMTGEGRCLLMLQQATPRLVALHLSDNAGQSDEHLGLGAGTVPLEAMTAWLMANRYNGHWVLELRRADDLQPSAARLHHLRSCYQQLGRHVL